MGFATLIVLAVCLHGTVSLSLPTSTLTNLLGQIAKSPNGMINLICKFGPVTSNFDSLQSVFNSNPDVQNVISKATSLGLPVADLYITNGLGITGVNADTLNILLNLITTLPTVSEIRQALSFPIMQTTVTETTCEDNNWNVLRIGADKVWKQMGNTNDGRGIVVANIDTGVRYTHKDLADNYRNDGYGWYDPYDYNQFPMDGHGHGTHTMGSIAGRNGIGAAPGATWMACRGCNSDTCEEIQLLLCGQWIARPTKWDNSSADATKRPNIVSCSWGIMSPMKTNWYDDVINTWRNKSIIPVFALGNSGPMCGTGASPANNPNVISVGSTSNGTNDPIADYSSRGTTTGAIKPEISAPGSDIRSASNASDTGYQCMSGTSMACPLTAGTIALMMQKNPTWGFKEILQALQSSAVQPAFSSAAMACPYPLPGNCFPNFNYGAGRIDALKATNNEARTTSKTCSMFG